MTTFTLHPMVVGTKIFDKGMMTYQHDYGQSYTISMYSFASVGSTPEREGEL